MEDNTVPKRMLKGRLQSKRTNGERMEREGEE
jgi:hypothetical protein